MIYTYIFISKKSIINTNMAIKGVGYNDVLLPITLYPSVLAKIPQGAFPLLSAFKMGDAHVNWSKAPHMHTNHEPGHGFRARIW